MKKKPPPNILEFCLGPADPIRMETYRLAIGFSMLVYFATWWMHAREWLTELGFHVSQAALRNFPMLPLLPETWLAPVGIIFFGALAAWTLGFHTRLTCPLVFAGVVYFNHVDVLSSYTLNKMFVVSMAIFLCVPHGRQKRGEMAPKKISSWPIRILQATLIIHYFFAGWAKMRYGDWLRDPFVLWSQIQGVYKTEIAAWMLSFFPIGVWSWMQYAALTFEMTAPITFGFKRLRPLGLAVGASFQILVALTMHMLIFFSLQMLSLYVLFLPEENLLRFRAKFPFLFGRPVGR